MNTKFTKEILPATFEEFFQGIPAKFAPSGVTLETGTYIPAWEGAATRIQIQFPLPNDIGLDTGVRLKLRSFVTYESAKQLIGTDDEGIWIDGFGDKRILTPFKGKQKRLYSPPVAA